MPAEGEDASIHRLTDEVVRELRPRLRQYLRSRYRALPDQEDVVQETLVDLHRAVATYRLSDDVDQSISRLAFAILSRRAADRYRRQLREAILVDLDPEDEHNPISPSAEAVASYRQLLTIAMEFIATLRPEDRSLLLDQAVGVVRQDAQSPALRKRLSRLRAELREVLNPHRPRKTSNQEQ